MESVISNDDRVAIAEVDYVIHHMNERYISKIPQKILDYITILKKRNIDIYVDPKIPLEKQGLREFTLYFLMILNLKYWCNDERRKEILAMMENNQKKFDDRVNDIFKQAESMEGSTSSSSDQDLSKPKKIIVANVPEEPKETVENSVSNESEENKAEANVEANIKEDSNENKVESEKNDATPVVSNKPKENFFTRLINKIKAIIKK